MSLVHRVDGHHQPLAPPGVSFEAVGAQLLPAAHRVLGGGAALLILRATRGSPWIDLPMHDFVDAVA